MTNRRARRITVTAYPAASRLTVQEPLPCVYGEEHNAASGEEEHQPRWKRARRERACQGRGPTGMHQTDYSAPFVPLRADVLRAETLLRVKPRMLSLAGLME